jgi:hypothetical protein
MKPLLCTLAITTALVAAQPASATHGQLVCPHERAAAGTIALTEAQMASLLELVRLLLIQGADDDDELRDELADLQAARQAPPTESAAKLWRAEPCIR